MVPGLTADSGGGGDSLTGDRVEEGSEEEGRSDGEVEVDGVDVVIVVL